MSGIHFNEQKTIPVLVNYEKEECLFADNEADWRMCNVAVYTQACLF
jgi:hypothetical protein